MAIQKTLKKIKFDPASVILPVVIKCPGERNIRKGLFCLIVHDGWEVMANGSPGSLSRGLYSQEDEREECGAQLTLPFLLSLGFSP